MVLNTCAVRENADNKLYGNLGHLHPVKQAHPGMQIAVGGCLAQKDRGEIVRRAPWVDVVFGTHNIGSLPALLERARHNHEAQVEILESLEVFPSTLPTRRESPYAAWVSVSVGCNNTCTFCIVPSLRGKEVDRRPGEVLAEIEALVGEGVLEVTLLGQNVNTYGVEFGDRLAFGKLLRACGDVDGLERVRFTSPHPAAFTDDVIDAMAETPNVMPSLHMPLQSGSDRVLKAMRRSYRAERYLGIIDRVRAAMPDAAITTDIIVGFPGETEADFEATLDVVRAARFASAFTFQYSPRPGTPAATMADQVPKAVVQQRYERLDRPAGGDLLGGEPRPGRPHPRRPGRHRRGPQGRRDRRACPAAPGQPARPLRRPRGRRAAPARGRRDRRGHLRRAPPPGGRRRARGGPYDVRRTRAGDAWAARQDAPADAERRRHRPSRGRPRPAPSAAPPARGPAGPAGRQLGDGGVGVRGRLGLGPVDRRRVGPGSGPGPASGSGSGRAGRRVGRRAGSVRVGVGCPAASAVRGRGRRSRRRRRQSATLSRPWCALARTASILSWYLSPVRSDTTAAVLSIAVPIRSRFSPASSTVLFLAVSAASLISPAACSASSCARSVTFLNLSENPMA